MIYSVKSFTQINKDAKDMVFLLDRVFNDLNRIIYSMAGGIRFAEPKLVFVQNTLRLEETIDTSLNNFF